VLVAGAYWCLNICCRAAELEAFESLGSTKITSIEAVSNSGYSAEKHESTSEAAEDFKDVPTKEDLSIVPSHITSDGSAALNEHFGSSSSIVSSQLFSAVQTSGRVEAQTVEAALELQNRVTNLLTPLQGALGAPGGWEHAAAAARLRSKRDKIHRNRKWRKRKRQRIAEARRKVCYQHFLPFLKPRFRVSRLSFWLIFLGERGIVA